LEPLKGMQLDMLACGHTRISDLTPLKGMCLTIFDCNNTQVSDLRPLTGAPLKELLIHETKVTDLTPLAGMTLENLIFTPGNITKGIKVVRDMKTIEWFGVQSYYNAKQYTPEEFWEMYDAGKFQ
jgi:internalin A